MQRGFEVVTKYQNQNLNLPYRTTEHAAGYDFEAAEDFVLPSIWKTNFLKVLWALHHQKTISEEDLKKGSQDLKPYLVPTGIKAYMQDSEYLLVANRSSSPLKRNLILPNGVGIIDADYYNNAANEGEIFFQLINMGLRDVTIKKGERIGQGIFMPYLKADGTDERATKRTGGFGSSGK
ncbi:dUTP diphosphatase [Pediococcus siamensis]|uniref:dUTP diphosphatase n=1 Tax=Pediococcus siamensis TaxID=381829 RepID=UPI0039A1913B